LDLWGLSTTGIQFLLQTKDKWEGVEMVATFSPAVSEELKIQFVHEFQLKADVNQIYR